MLLPNRILMKSWARRKLVLLENHELLGTSAVIRGKSKSFNAPSYCFNLASDRCLKRRLSAPRPTCCSMKGSTRYSYSLLFLVDR